MDFSTPMSTIVHSGTTRKSQSNASMNILDKLLQKFHEHRTNFSQTQSYLNLLDNHIRELTIVLQQLQNSLDHQSLLKSTTDQLETRLVQMSSKREQIRTVIDQFQHQSPGVNQTLDEILHQVFCFSFIVYLIHFSLIFFQISPSRSVDSSISYPELITAIKLSFNQKKNFIDRIHQEENHLQYRTVRIHQRQERLLQLIEKLLEQQKLNEKHLDFVHSTSFELHAKQLQEFNELHEEYQFLQNENRQLKQMAKENIKTLYHFIEPSKE